VSGRLNTIVWTITESDPSAPAKHDWAPYISSLTVVTVEELVVEVTVVVLLDVVVLFVSILVDVLFDVLVLVVVVVFVVMVVVVTLVLVVVVFVVLVVEVLLVFVVLVMVAVVVFVVVVLVVVVLVVDVMFVVVVLFVVVAVVVVVVVVVIGTPTRDPHRSPAAASDAINLLICEPSAVLKRYTAPFALSSFLLPTTTTSADKATDVPNSSFAVLAGLESVHSNEEDEEPEGTENT